MDDLGEIEVRNEKIEPIMSDSGVSVSSARMVELEEKILPLGPSEIPLGPAESSTGATLDGKREKKKRGKDKRVSG